MTVKINSQPVNLLGKELLDAFDQLFDFLNGDKQCKIKVIVFKSALDDIFMAHEDLAYMKHDIKKDAQDIRTTLNKMADLPQVTIAEVQGMARGAGLSFILTCDMRFVSTGRFVSQFFEVS